MSTLTPIQQMLARLGTCAFAVGSYYLVRPLPNPWLRGTIASLGCAGLTAFICKDLPKGMGAVMTISLCWMSSIKLVHLMLMPEEDRRSLTLKEYAKKFLWFLFPVSENPRPRKGMEWAKHVAYFLGVGVGSLVLEDWMYRWLSYALEQIGGGEVVRQSLRLTFIYTAMWGVLALAGCWMNNLQVALVSLLTQDRYQLQEFCDWPVIAASPREFWGRRYNRLVGTLLHESIFTPLRKQARWSATSAAMASFIVSAVLHVHVAVAGLGESPLNGGIKSFLFFFLHGAACVLDSYYKLDQKVPKPVAIGLTQGFLLATAPLYPAFFVYSFDTWFPPSSCPIHLPIPSFYPK